MEDFSVLVICLVTCLLLLVPAVQLYHRHPALVRWRGYIVVSALVWGMMPAFKIFILDKIIRQNDGIYHERLARSVAESLLYNNFTNLSDHFGYGNRGYQFLLGIFYALTNAPSAAPYAINAGFAFLGSLSLLHVICKQTGCDRVPWWLILLTLFLPSALFWTPGNLKEGLCLWGICMMLRAHLRDPRTGARESSLLPLLGFVILSLMRPHFGIAFGMAIGLGMFIGEMRFQYIIAMGIGVLLSFQAFQIMSPNLAEDLTESGLVESMEAMYEKNKGMGGSAIYHPGGVPIPVITGLTLIFLRPFPHEISGFAEILAALEVWFITAIGAWGWIRFPNKRRVLLQPFSLTLLAAILFMALFFSYFYNMGLLVRQRLFVLPPVIALTAIPHLLSQKQFPAVGIGPQNSH